jgi:hypothetical protein
VFTECCHEYGPFRGPFVKNSFFYKEEFLNEYYGLLFILFILVIVCHIFKKKSNLGRYEFS